MLTFPNPYRALTLSIIFLTLSACETVPEPTPEPTPTVQQPIVETVTPTPLSAKAIENPPKELLIQAQAQLKSLGYRVGFVDGIWGKRSVSAIKKFELDHNLISANGQLSELNLDILNALAPANSISYQQPSQQLQPKPLSLAKKIDVSKLNSNSPQLIIIEEPYPLLLKANPFSAVIKQLEKGTGIYILSQQGIDWFEVETLDNERGFIKSN